MKEEKVKKSKTKKIQYTLVITPAISPVERGKIQDVLAKMGYKVDGGGTWTDMSECDISFEK